MTWGSPLGRDARSEARTQGASIAEAIGATEDAASGEQRGPSDQSLLRQPSYTEANDSPTTPGHSAIGWSAESVARVVSPDIVLGVSKTLIVSYPNPTNERLQVTTRVQARCPFPFSGQHVSVMLEIVDTATLQTTVALQATVQSSKR